MDSKIDLLKGKIQAALEALEKAYESGDASRIARAEKEMERSENELGAYLETKRRILRENQQAPERVARIANNIVAASVPQWLREIDYDLSVARGGVPAYNSYVGSLMWIDRGIACMKNQKKAIVMRVGESEYNELVKAFDELKEAWSKVGEADEEVTKQQINLKAIQDKFADLDKRVMRW